MVATICAGVSGPQNVCNKTLEAANIQSGLYQSVNQIENTLKNKAEKEAQKTIGNSAYKLFAYGVIATKISSGGTGSVRIGGGSFCNNVIFVGSKKQGSLGFGWNF